MQKHWFGKNLPLIFIWDELFFEVNQSQKCSTFCSSDYIIVQFFLLRTTFKVVAIGKRSQLFLGRFYAEHSLRGSVMRAGGTWWSLLGRLDELLLAVCGKVKKPPGRSGIQLGLVSAKHPDIGHPHNKSDNCNIGCDKCKIVFAQWKSLDLAAHQSSAKNSI